MTQSLKTTKKLRDESIRTEVYPNPQDKLQKQLKYANKKSIPYVIIIGPEEVEKGFVTLKNMVSGEQKTDNLAKIITSNITKPLP